MFFIGQSGHTSEPPATSPVPDQSTVKEPQLPQCGHISELPVSQSWVSPFTGTPPAPDHPTPQDPEPPKKSSRLSLSNLRKRLKGNYTGTGV